MASVSPRYLLRPFNQFGALEASLSSEHTRESPSARTAIVIGVLIAVIPAIVGYIWSYADGIRKDKLAFTNKQIENLYGPLHGLAQANDAAWCEFVTSGNSPVDWNKLTKEEVKLWRVWMPKVLQPMNAKINEIIVSNSQLLVSDKIPAMFRAIIAHTEAYRALIAIWNDDEKDEAKYTKKSQNTVEPPYPDNLDLCVRPIYIALKNQEKILQNNIFRTFSLEPLPNPPDCDKPTQNPHKCDDFLSALKRP